MRKSTGIRARLDWSSWWFHRLEKRRIFRCGNACLRTRNRGIVPSDKDVEQWSQARQAERMLWVAMNVLVGVGFLPSSVVGAGTTGWLEAAGRSEFEPRATQKELQEVRTGDPHDL